MTLTDLFARLCAGLYFTSLAGLACYGLHRLWLLACWMNERHRPDPLPPSAAAGEELPIVTVQLPLYNEQFVAVRLLDAAAALDWSAERLEIQVLDDSNDATCALVDARSAYWRQRGIDMQVIRRTERSGYKAGALATGLKSARGSLVAIFDADFIPSPDFLRRTVAQFRDPRIGMVQTRWSFCNSEHSWLTRVQTILLEPHFRIEHLVRFRRGLFFNFNGTAGIWRRQAIEAAGGWQADTVTEDLDLSYRAQLAGWRFICLDEVAVPSELPVTLAAFRSQQQRWAKGSLQTARKLLPRIWRAPLPLQIKVEAGFHLLANFGWLLATLIVLTLYPVMTWRVGIGPYQLLRLDLPLFFGASAALTFFFLLHLLVRRNFASLRYLPLLPALCIGLAPSLLFAIFQGLTRRGGIFERTPKFGLTGRGRRRALSNIYAQKGCAYLLLNLLLFTYSLLPLAFSWDRRVWAAIPLAALFPAGFLLLIWREGSDRLTRYFSMRSSR
ncbi:glycosyltransferase [Desulfuromonas carbonis]|uniref:glycosyltransferase n=1 Tax=Desulfuromonas sp. DDH964 TaxID=1823759 RepID=UPI00078B5B4A|nr:glycosyltransferase [Desulfuromonas sp. DDH964]AMV70567.1 CESA-like subfamily glycosyltransferase [Desulfuromonas sp. DDH964]